MFTLKLYRNGPGSGRTVIMETVGLWVDGLPSGAKFVRAFRKTVGVMDEDGTPEFIVGADGPPKHPTLDEASAGAPPPALAHDYYDWGVLENAQGKTTEMLR